MTVYDAVKASVDVPDEPETVTGTNEVVGTILSPEWLDDQVRRIIAQAKKDAAETDRSERGLLLVMSHAHDL